MSGLDGFPRRKRSAHGAAAATPRAAPSKTHRAPIPGEASREALDIARYVEEMTAQLEAMAAAADLDLLAYFLGMAKAEAGMFLRTIVEADATEEISKGEGCDREA